MQTTDEGVTFLDDDPAAGSAAQDYEIVDAQIAPPYGNPCPNCGSPVEPGDRFCPSCGTANAAAAAPPSDDTAETGDTQETEKKHFRCQNCGAEVATDPRQRSYVCPFCDSTYVVEFSAASGRQRPEFVIGFAVTHEQAEETLRRWLNERAWHRPGDLHLARLEGKLRGIYLPFWSFSMLAESRWDARIGEYWYRTETYTTTDSKGRMVTRTRQVRETEWWPLAGDHHRYYSGYLVSGSHGLPQRDADRLQPYQMPALVRYQPLYLAGWLSEEYSIDGPEALKTCQEHFRQQERQHIRAFLPGDTSKGLLATTHFSHMHSDLCLLPVYLVSYRYREKLYRILINGQTGRINGDKPVSHRRIWAAIGGGVALLILFVLLIALLASLMH